VGDDPVLGHINWSPDFGTQAASATQALQIVVAMGRVREWYTRAARNAYEQVAVKLLMKGFSVIEATGMLQELRTAAHAEAGFYGCDA
jgi:hypothetical protein